MDDSTFCPPDDGDARLGTYITTSTGPCKSPQLTFEPYPVKWFVLGRARSGTLVGTLTELRVFTEERGYLTHYSRESESFDADELLMTHFSPRELFHLERLSRTLSRTIDRFRRYPGSRTTSRFDAVPFVLLLECEGWQTGTIDRLPVEPEPIDTLGTRIPAR